MVAKSMIPQKFCQGCNQEHDCQDIHQELANFKGRSVVFKVCLAFLLPILVFIASLAVSERILAEAIDTEELRTALSFLLALSVTFGLILIIKLINKQFMAIFRHEAQY